MAFISGKFIIIMSANYRLFGNDLLILNRIAITITIRCSVVVCKNVTER